MVVMNGVEAEAALLARYADPFDLSSRPARPPDPEDAKLDELVTGIRQATDIDHQLDLLISNVALSAEELEARYSFLSQVEAWLHLHYWPDCVSLVVTGSCRSGLALRGCDLDIACTFPRATPAPQSQWSGNGFSQPAGAFGRLNGFEKHSQSQKTPPKPTASPPTDRGDGATSQSSSRSSKSVRLAAQFQPSTAADSAPTQAQCSTAAPARSYNDIIDGSSRISLEDLQSLSSAQLCNLLSDHLKALSSQGLLPLSDIESVTETRCPIVRFNALIGSEGKVPCDVSFDNSAGLNNSAWLRAVSNSDPRFRNYFLFIKYWATLVRLPKLSKYAVTLMAIAYLMDADLVYSLEEARRVSRCSENMQPVTTGCLGSYDLSYPEPWPRKAQPPELYTLSTRLLIYDFFRLFFEIEFQTRKITPLFGGVLKYSQSDCVDAEVFIQDPFVCDHNLADRLYGRVREFMEEKFDDAFHSYDAAMQSCIVDWNRDWGICDFVRHVYQFGVRTGRAYTTPALGNGLSDTFNQLTLSRERGDSHSTDSESVELEFGVKSRSLAQRSLPRLLLSLPGSVITADVFASLCDKVQHFLTYVLALGQVSRVQAEECSGCVMLDVCATPATTRLYSAQLQMFGCVLRSASHKQCALSRQQFGARMIVALRGAQQVSIFVSATDQESNTAVEVLSMFLAVFLPKYLPTVGMLFTSCLK